MKIKLFSLLLLSLSQFLFAELPVPKRPSLKSHIIDQAQVYSAREEAQLSTYLEQYFDSAKINMTILTVNSLEGEAIGSFSIRVLDEWAKDELFEKEYKSDLLFVISKNDRKSRIEVGRNLEGAIPDAKAGDFLRALPPYFKKGDFFGGTVMIIASCAKASGGKINAKAKPAPKRKKKSAADYIIFVIFVIFFVMSMFSRGGRGGGIFIMGSGRGGGGFSGGGGGWGGGGGGFSGGGASGSW